MVGVCAEPPLRAPPPHADPEEQCFFILNPGFDGKGEVLANGSVGSVEACCAAAQAHMLANTFVYCPDPEGELPGVDHVSCALAPAAGGVIALRSPACPASGCAPMSARRRMRARGTASNSIYTVAKSNNSHYYAQ